MHGPEALPRPAVLVARDQEIQRLTWTPDDVCFYPKNNGKPLKNFKGGGL